MPTAQLMLPKPQDRPLLLTKRPVYETVARTIRRELVQPEILVRPGFAAVYRTPMPKAPVDEYSDFPCLENEVRLHLTAPPPQAVLRSQQADRQVAAPASDSMGAKEGHECNLCCLVFPAAN